MNIFDLGKATRQREVVETIQEDKNIRIEKILSLGQTTDWMIQDQDEWVLVLEGYGVIEFEGEKIVLEKGQSLTIKKGIKHRVSETDPKRPTLWLAVYYDN